MLRNRRIVVLTDDRPWWMKSGVRPIVCYQPKGAASLSASYANLVNPGVYNAYQGGFNAPGFLSGSGWIFSGIQYIGTGLLTSSGMTWIIRIYNGVTTSGWRCAFGGQKGTAPGDGMCFYNSTTTTKHLYKNGTTALQPAGNVASGVFAATPTTAYKNGVSEGSIDNTISTATEIFIACNNSGGSKVDLYTGDIVAVAFYNIELTPSQIMDVTVAMNEI